VDQLGYQVRSLATRVPPSAGILASGSEVTTRKITYDGAASLDGYFARKNDEMDWLLWSDELGVVMSEYWGRPLGWITP
jgi:hypothetical protein